MSLGAGARLGPYEILGPLGAGGMGEVYRAHDPRLARDVAVKVLPSGLTRDPERLRRFEQEAKAVGALNHPNILSVFDAGTAEGSPYVVTELLEGQTLRERMSGAALPVRRAVEIGAQVARGLAAAHDKGIVHRDLKPENVFVTRDGQVKVLDFGLAKLMHPTVDEEDNELATKTRETDPGTVMGTAGYMSPEQVRGRAVDHRSDIFSFGAILYEMLGGRRAFKRETSADTMAAVLNEDPPELSEINRALPPALERIVRHCLEKNPEERFASARDLAFDLQSLSDPSASMPRAVARRRGLGAKTAAMVLAWTAGVAGGAFWLGRTREPPSSPLYRKLTFRRGTVGSARFSPDGTYFLYSASWAGGPSQVYSTRLDLPGDLPLDLVGRLAGTGAGELLVLRPDGMLVRAPLSGGGARELAEDVKLADVTRDGSRVAVVRKVGPKERLEFPPGTTLYATLGSIVDFRVSPDGKRLALVEQPNSDFVQAEVSVVDLVGSKRTLTPPRVCRDPVWSPDAGEIWFYADEPEGGYTLRAVSLAGRERVLMRTAQRPSLHDTLSTGRVLLGLSDFRQEVTGLGPGQDRERDLSWLDAPQAYDLSADGTTFVLSASQPGREEPSAYLGRMDGSLPVRLGEGMVCGLSPDGRFVATMGPGFKSLTVLPTGAGEMKHLAPGTIHDYFDARWLPDGKRLLIAGNEEGRPRRLFLQDLEGGLPRPVTPEGITTDYALASPDGRWVPAGIDWGQAPYALYPIDGGEPRPILGLAKGELPLRFDTDGSHLFLWANKSPEALTARILRLDLRSGRKDLWKEISPADPAGFGGISYVYLTPDGRGHVYNSIRRLSTLYLVEGLR